MKTSIINGSEVSRLSVAIHRDKNGKIIVRQIKELIHVGKMVNDSFTWVFVYDIH